MADYTVSADYTVKDEASKPLDDIADAAAETAKSTDELADQVEAAKAALSVLRQGAGEAAAGLAKLKAAGSATEKELLDAEEAVRKANAALSAGRKAASEAAAGLKQVQESAKGAGGASLLQAAAFTDLASKAFEAAKAILGVAQEVADLRNDLADASTRSGVAAETLAGLRLAAEGSGLAFSDFSEALNQLPKRISDTARGTGEAMTAFKALGVSVKNTDGSLKNADTVLRETLTSLAQIEDPTLRAAAATSIFGESGGKLLQALGDTSKLDGFVATAERFGVDIGPGAATAAGDWQRSSALLGLQIDGLKAGVVDFLAPGDKLRALNIGLAAVTATLAEQFDAVTDTVTALTEAFLVMLNGGIEGGLRRIGEAFVTLITRYGGAGKKGIEAAKDVIAYEDGLKGAAAAATKAAEATGGYTQNLKLLSQNSAEATKAQEDVAGFVDRSTQVLIAGLSAQDQAVANAAKQLADYRREQEKLKASGDVVNATVTQLQKNLAAATQAREFAAGIAEATAEFEAMVAPVKAMPSAFAELSDSIAEIVPPDVLTDLEKLALLGFDLQRAFAEGSIDAEQFAALRGQLNGATAAANAAQGTKQADKIDTVVGGVVGGSLSQALAPLLDTLGPKGMIVSTILGILEQGPETIKAILLGVPDLLGDVIGTVLELIPMLPSILEQVITDVVKLLPDILLAVFSLVYGPIAFELSAMLIKLIPVLVKELTLGLLDLALKLPGILFDSVQAAGFALKALATLPRELVVQARDVLIPTLIKGIVRGFQDVAEDALGRLGLEKETRRNGDPRRIVQAIDRIQERRLRRRAT